MMTRDDKLGMGTMVPHQICDQCKGEPPEPDESFRVLDISLVTYSDDNIRQAAERVGTTEEEVRAYLAGEATQTRGIAEALYYVSGCYPFRKVNDGDPQSEP